MCWHPRIARIAEWAIVTAIIVALSPAPTFAQAVPPAPPPASPWKISGYMFGDYYDFVQDNDAKFDGQHGFWLRRAYLTYDHTLSPKFATRLRLEMNSNGKLAGGTLVPYVKDAYLRWTFTGRQQLFIGIQPTATFEVIEGVWGYRFIEKTPGDLYKLDSTRDLGVTVSGPLNKSGSFKYVAQFGNDSGNASETDKYKGVRLGARYEKNPGFVVEGFYAFLDRPKDADRQMLQGFMAYQHKKGRVGFQYLWQERKPTAGTTAPSVNVSVVSGFGVFTVRPQKVVLFGRLDRVLDPLPDGGLDYLPISTASPFTFGVAGVEFFLHPSVRFAPNVEFVNYGTPRNTAIEQPKNDVVLRATFYWTW
jgi:hypothetical protein